MNLVSGCDDGSVQTYQSADEDAASPPRTLEPNERPDAERTVQQSDAGLAPSDTLRLEVIPNQSVYRPQDTFRIRVYQMTPDGMSDDVTGLVEFSILSNDVVEQFDDNRFRAIAVGRATVQACVPNGCGRVPILVSEEPLVVFETPTPGSMEGGQGTVPMLATGRVVNSTGIPRLTLNGMVVSLAADGSFEHPLTPTFGINRISHTVSDDNTLWVQIDTLSGSGRLDTPSPADDKSLSDAIVGRLDQVTLDAGNTQPQIDGPIILTDSMATLLEVLIAEGTSGLIPTIPRFEMEGVRRRNRSLSEQPMCRSPTQD